MLIKKILETYLDITDPNDIYSSDKDAMLIDKLTEKFVGVCYNSCYILKINKIIRRSYMYIKDTLDGDSSISIKFEVDAIIYNSGEILNGCKIIKKEPNGIVHAKSQYAGVQLSIQSNMSIFKEGDVIPVIIKRVRYNVNQSAISISALPFMPLEYTHVYNKLTGELDKQQHAQLKTLVTQIQQLKQNFDNLKAGDKKIYKFFNDLLSSSGKNTIPKSATRLDVTTILGMDSYNDIILYKPNLPYDDITIYKLVSNESMEADDATPAVISESAYIVLYTILLKHLSNLQILEDFIKYYPTFDAVQKTKEIWKLYSMLKK